MNIPVILEYDPHKRYRVVEEADIRLRNHSNQGHEHPASHVLVAGRTETGNVVYLAGSTMNHSTIRPHSIWSMEIIWYKRRTPEECTLPHLRTESGLEKKANGE